MSWQTSCFVRIWCKRAWGGNSTTIHNIVLAVCAFKHGPEQNCKADDSNDSNAIFLEEHNRAKGGSQTKIRRTHDHRNLFGHSSHDNFRGGVRI